MSEEQFLLAAEESELLAPPQVTEPPSLSWRSNNIQYTLRKIFLGPKGILAGWSILIFFGMLIASVIPIGLHAGWDWAQSYFYGVADSGMIVQRRLLSMHPIGNKLWSGGAVGPEGSPLSIVVEIAIAIGIWFYWRRPREEEQGLESAHV